ncbi:MAG: 4-hydroxy-3-methylbut-2-enyl diphosphate reductase, partial [Pseudohongiellaceae bacterium]
EAYLIDSAEEIHDCWLQGKSRVGVTAGASAPEVLVQEVIQRIQELGGGQLQEMAGAEENITFSMPRDLRIS